MTEIMWDVPTWTDVAVAVLDDEGGIGCSGGRDEKCDVSPQPSWSQFYE